MKTILAALLLSITTLASAQQTFIQINNADGTVGATGWASRSGNTVTIRPSTTRSEQTPLVIAPVEPRRTATPTGDYSGVVDFLQRPSQPRYGQVFMVSQQEPEYAQCARSSTPIEFCDLAWLISNRYIGTDEYQYARSKGFTVAEIVTVVMKSPRRLP